ncbi:MAG: hypothetical protein ACOCYT_04405 [Chloroflexota bacterium]
MTQLQRYHVAILVAVGLIVGVVLSRAVPAAGQQEPTPTPPNIPYALPFLRTPLPPTEPPPDFVIAPAEGQEIDPPISIELPDDWVSLNNTVMIRDLTGLRLIPFTVYTGPVTDGQGYIVLLWGYETIGRQGNPLAGEQPEYGPYLDALRLLRLAVVGTDCVTGTDVEREFSLGEVTTTGANFSTYRCEETTNTRGWFLGTQQDGLNFAFYAYAEPIEAMDGEAPFELQAILDTVTFEVEAFRETLEAAPIQTPTPAAP